MADAARASTMGADAGGADTPKGGTGEERDVAALVEALTAPETVRDPYPLYDALRPHSPVYGYKDWPPGTVPGADEPVTAWALFSHEQVTATARDHRTFSSRDPLQEASPAPSLMLVNHDNPEHDRLRGLIAKAFSPKRVEDLRPWAKELCGTLVAPLEGREFDAAQEIAAIVPARVMVRLFGLPDDTWTSVKRWANAFMLSEAMPPEERGASNVEMMEKLTQWVGERAEALEAGEAENGGLIDAMLKAEGPEGGLTVEEVIRFCMTLLVAGAETTVHLIGKALAVLADHPDVQARLKADRSLMRRFLDETMRLEGPPQRLFRIATEETTVGGAQIRKGDWVAIFFASANHDPAVFPDPRRFDLDRPNAQKQLSLGLGIHHCLGAPLARVEAESVIDAIFERGLSVRPGQGAREKQTATMLTNGYTKLPLRLEALTPERGA